MNTVQNARPVLPEDVSDFSDDEFRDLVDDDLRKATRPDEAQALRSPMIVSRWIAQLESMRKSVEGQLAASRCENEVLRLECRKKIQDFPEMSAEIERRLDNERAKYEKSRAGKIRFKVGVEQQLIEAHYLRDSYNPEAAFLRNERDQLLREVWRLQGAITEHRKQTESEVLDQDEVDSVLWQTVGN